MRGRRPHPRVTTVVTGVSASQALFEAAIDHGAQAIIVHHGLFWKNQWPLRVRGAMRQRLKLLLENDVSLFGYHLPLDAHPEVGNNAQLALRIGLEQTQGFGAMSGRMIGISGALNPPLSPEALADRLADVLGARPTLFGGQRGPVRTLGIISGGAGYQLSDAICQTFDPTDTSNNKSLPVKKLADKTVTMDSAALSALPPGAEAPAAKQPKAKKAKVAEGGASDAAPPAEQAARLGVGHYLWLKQLVEEDEAFDFNIIAATHSGEASGGKRTPAKRPRPKAADGGRGSGRGSGRGGRGGRGSAAKQSKPKSGKKRKVCHLSQTAPALAAPRLTLPRPCPRCAGQVRLERRGRQ